MRHELGGRVTALAPGAVTITATVDGKTGSAQLVVAPAPVHSVVVSPAGFVLEVGAEGVFACRTRLLASGFGAQELVTDEDVRAAREPRREDLPGQPLAWRAALRGLATRPAARSSDG